ncbi:hypothetical protein NECAME_12335 [Necator americanus]|uniref:MSP domain-containing protein n=1 Tax=Necator americanus TaxID=51031 RepID=W2T3D5_NECAM|nr:hypothetical protein NECAME_12335 [Necator americanus]ETN75487.1 hypothetical protein NECAME_12335 [Necator americanus]
MSMVIPSMVVPSQNPLFVGIGGSRRELRSNSDRKIAFKLVFPPNSNYSAQETFGVIPELGKVTILLTRAVGFSFFSTEEKMTIQYAAMANGQTDPAASFASGTPTGEFIGETENHVSMKEPQSQMLIF